MNVKSLGFALGLLLLPLNTAFAAEELNTGNTAWIIVSTALVMMMTPAGLALFYGNAKQLWIQLVSVLGTAAYAAVGTLIVIGITRFLTGSLRIDKDSEVQGLDNAFHGERGFEIQ